VNTFSNSKISSSVFMALIYSNSIQTNCPENCLTCASSSACSFCRYPFKLFPNGMCYCQSQDKLGISFNINDGNLIISEVCQSSNLFDSTCINQLDYLLGFDALDLESYQVVENGVYSVKISYLQDSNFALGKKLNPFLM
jgi:hypothetical protein